MFISPYSNPAEYLTNILQVRGVEPQYRKQLLSVLCYFLANQPHPRRGKKWLALPELCYAAAGGKGRCTTAVSTTWLFLWIAAHLMDAVEDEESDHPLIEQFGTGLVLNAATGFYFAAGAMLYHLEEWGIEPSAANDVRAAFQERSLRMAGGQYLDLAPLELDLAETLEVAALKSGEFFALACYAGARLATDSSEVLGHFLSFGRQLGVIKQIADDLEGLHEGGQRELERMGANIPIAYALNHLPEEQRDWLLARLKAHLSGPSDLTTAVKMIEESGALIYCFLEIGKQKSVAEAELLSACPDSPDRQKLLDLIQ